ncbi:type II toxin-antitoxin system VapC family toxin [Gemmatimonas sp.]|uniref:type II toxin-antitoxin system VapC family toxin n=1 Tax=Gemmatimonas sp. TaxID=1962908 RepID=UPI0031B84EA1
MRPLWTSGMTPERTGVSYGKRLKTAATKRVRETPARPLLLDTAVLLWWLQDPARLSRAAAAHLASAQHTTVLVSSVSFWEIGLKAERGMLELGDSFDGFLTRIESMSGLSILPVDLVIWRQVLALEWDHRDPADRIIVATAMHHQATLLSSDRAIRAFFREAVW